MFQTMAFDSSDPHHIARRCTSNCNRWHTTPLSLRAILRYMTGSAASGVEAVHRVAAGGISPEQAVDEAIARIKEIPSE
jgi:hypothetical protein